MQVQIFRTITLVNLATATYTFNKNITLIAPAWLQKDYLSDIENHHRLLPFTLLVNQITNPTPPSRASFETAYSLLYPLTHQHLITEPNPAYDDPEYYLEIIFKSLLNIAIQLPPLHPGHGNLISILHVLESQPPCLPPGKEIHNIPRHWNTIHTFHRILDVMFSARGEAYNFTAEEWLNLNAFTATLSIDEGASRSISPRSYPGRTWEHGFWTFRNALELNIPIEKLEYHIPAAVIWIWITGSCMMWDRRQLAEPWREDWMFERDPEQWNLVVDRDFTGKLRAGEASFWKGRRGMSEARMKFWGRRFEELSRVKYLKDETKEWARNGAGAMEGVWEEMSLSGCY